MSSSKPHFYLPTIHDSQGGWGPASNVVPEQFRDIPYAPYSKGDKLGRVADWTNPEGQKQDNRETGRQGRTGFNRFNRGKLSENNIILRNMFLIQMRFIS
jgi:translation initiation factor 3 subunit D